MGLHVRVVWSGFSLCDLWISVSPWFLNTTDGDSDRAVRMCGLVFALLGIGM